MEPGLSTETIASYFPALWDASTADSNLTLHGFRRFKTAHLLNLRFLETEIAQVDREIYQAGLSLNHSLTTHDRLRLSYCTKEDAVPPIEETITVELVLRLRALMRQYGTLASAINKYG